MRFSKEKNNNRHLTAVVTPLTINMVHYRNPWVVAWWSAAFPGYGHIMLCKYMFAFILISWEIIVNYLCHLNTAIFYSMIGDIEKAKAVIDKKWFFFYMVPYVFCIWDSYRSAVQFNREFRLAAAQGFKMQLVNISGLELNKLQIRNPFVSWLWSLLAPGLGHFYINRTYSTLFGIVWLGIIFYMSNVPEALYSTMLGQPAKASMLMDPQWFLFLPSLYGFVPFDAFINTIEYNKLYKNEQRNFLKEEYQMISRMPI